MKAAMVCALICLPAAAEPVWQHEPSSVFGLPLGQPVPKSVPDCTTTKGHGQDHAGPVCLFRSFHTAADLPYTMGNLPFDGFVVTGTLQPYEGKTLSIQLGTLHDNFESLKRILIAKYGNPSRNTSGTVQSISGAVLPTTSVFWLGHHVSIVLMERAAKVNESAVIIRSEDMEGRRADKLSRQEKTAADRL